APHDLACDQALADEQRRDADTEAEPSAGDHEVARSAENIDDVGDAGRPRPGDEAWWLVFSGEGIRFEPEDQYGAGLLHDLDHDQALLAVEPAHLRGVGEIAHEALEGVGSRFTPG